MPRYITSGANFTPFTYEELVRPIDNMTQAYNTAQEQYDNLASTTAQLERYISDNPDDSETRNVYNSYMSVLQRMQDSLNGNGYSANTARDLSTARRLYGQQIVPMSEAIQRRRDWNDKYLQMQMEHPEMIMGRAPGSYSVRDYMNDTNFGGFKNYSSNQLTSDASSAAKAAAAALEKRPRTWTTEGVPAGYYQTEMTTGYTEQEVEDAMRAFRERKDSISGDDRANDLLQIAKDIYSKSGIGAWETDSDDIFNRAADAIGTGLRSGIGETKYEMVQRLDGIYSPNYKPTTIKDGDGEFLDLLTRYSRGVGLDYEVSPELKAITKAYDNDISSLELMRDSLNHEDSEIVKEYKQLKRDLSNNNIVHTADMRKRVADIEDEYPGISQIAFPSSYGNNPDSLNKLYRKYNITDNASIDDAIQEIVRQKNESVKAKTYYELNTPDAEFVNRKVASNVGFITDDNWKNKKLDFVTDMKGNEFITGSEFNELLKNSDSKDIKYQIRPYSGDIIIDSKDKRMIMSPTAFSHSMISANTAEEVALILRANNMTMNAPFVAQALYNYVMNPVNDDGTNATDSYMGAGTDAYRIITGLPNQIERMENAGYSKADIDSFVGTITELFWSVIHNDTNAFHKVRGKTGDKD